MNDETHDPLLGDPKLAAAVSKMQVKGNLIAARGRWVREQFGEARLEELAETVPEPARQYLLEPPLPFAWYPFEPMLAIDRRLIEGPMEGDATRMYDFGDAIARYDLSTLYKMLFKLGSPSFVIRRIGIVYGQYLRPGRAVGESHEAGRATVTIHDACFPAYFCTWGISGWLHAAIELSGGNQTTVEQTECVHHGASCCRFELRWS